MKKYTLSERQAIKDRLADEKYFECDRQLLVRLFPHHGLVIECNRVNAVNRLGLCRRIVYQLLSRVDADEIQRNRTESNGTIAGPSTGSQPIDSRQSANSQPIDSRQLADSKPVKKKASKADEFPGINWRDIENPDVQLCILLYDERISTWQQLCALRADIDKCPESALAIADLDDRNRMAQHELEVFQGTGVFPCKHPLAVTFMADRKQMEKWRQLRREDPKAFMKQVANIEHNIRRYNSELKKKLSAEKCERIKRNLANSERLNDLMQRVLKEGAE